MTIYYCSSEHGDDNAGGTSPNEAWRTLTKLRSLTLNPGDGIALEHGSQFERDYLHLTGAHGTPKRPITIGAYGNEALPRPAIHCDGEGVWFEDYHAPIGGCPHRSKGEVSTALLLFDCSYIEVRDVEISNRRLDDSDGHAYNDLDVMDRTGVTVIAQEYGTCRHIVLEHLYVHDVHGNVYDKHMANGGIYVIAHFPNDPARAKRRIARFDDVRILNNTVRDVNRWGIGVGYTAYLNYIDNGGKDADGTWNNTFDYGDGRISNETIATYGATNVLIEDNTVERAGGDAITVMYCDRPIIRHNVSREAAAQICDDIYTATLNDKVAAAIWPWRCKNALFEYNMAFDTLNADQGNGDGQAWDADYGDGTIYRHNYSHNNSGGAVMFCNEKAVNSEFYNNVSDRDRMGAIDIPRNPDAFIHDNVFIIATDAEPLRTARADGTARIEHNMFISAETRPGHAQWHPRGSHIEYRGNTYLGFANLPEDDNNNISNIPDNTQLISFIDPTALS